MKNHGQTIDAPGIVIPYSPGRKNYEAETSPHNLAEVSVRLLGALLLLYRQYVPQSSYYEVHHTAAQWLILPGRALRARVSDSPTPPRRENSPGHQN